MNFRRVTIHPDALAEAEAAVAWHRERNERAAQRFLDEVDRLILAIESNPLRFPERGFGARSAMMRRFPYQMVFLDESERFEIIAVAHGRRRPAYWRNRL